MKGSTDILQRLPPGKPPDALIERARELIHKAGYFENAADSAFGFSYDRSFIQYVQDSDKTSDRWRKVEKFSPIIFWYRQSPQALERLGMFLPGFAPSEVTTEDPPLRFSGEALVRLDTEGRNRLGDSVLGSWSRHLKMDARRAAEQSPLLRRYPGGMARLDS
jgi:hypothetical protein